MFKRLVKLSETHSFFLFGARGTGKSTLLRSEYSRDSCLWIDLLNPSTLSELEKNPNNFHELINAKPNATKIIIDEIQRIPELLDVVHSLTLKKKYQFILTGSSARKLKRNRANLLAGRAFNYFCHPLITGELGAEFNLNQVLQFGSLPEVFSLETKDKQEFLRSYIDTYFKEEIVAEQIIRNLRPFKNFLGVAAQTNGEPLNISAIAKDVQADHSTVQNYFEILEETLVGFLLEPFSRSVRKRQRQAAKFFYFDLGVQRSLLGLLESPLSPSSPDFGKAFEHFCILEIKRRIDYFKPDWKLSYLRTKDNAEIDLIIERPGSKFALIEFKSTDKLSTLSQAKLNSFAQITADIKNSETFLFSRDRVEKKIDHILFLHWEKMFDSLGLK